ncbi:MAG TPA: response regulator transcription factor [Aquabacterium sp.]|nr:response regulator transcription factor [Aquabacterium sp.]
MKLLVIDDHALFRDGLCLLLSSRLFCDPAQPVEVLEAGSLKQAEALIQEHPDVALVLLDLGLEEHRGLATLDVWRRLAPDVPVVVLSADDRPDVILSAIDAGASGFIPKSAQARVMQEALERVLAGGVYLPDLPQSWGRGLADVWGFSGRQADVLRLLIEGKANKEICRLLDLSESTVKTHLAAIFRKLGVNSRTQAVVAVAQSGWSLRSVNRT